MLDKSTDYIYNTLSVVTKKEEDQEDFKYTLTSLQNNAGQNRNMKITVANKYLESQVKFKPLQTILIVKACGSILLNVTLMSHFLKKRGSSTPLRKPKKLQIKFLADKFRECLLPFNSEILLSHSQSEAVNVKLKRNARLPVVAWCLYGCESWSLTLYEARTLWIFENKVLRIRARPQKQE